MIPISKLSVDSDIESEVLEVLRSGNLAQGPKVKLLEESFSQLTGYSNSIAVNNGTTALILALEAMNLQEGDVVITSPFTFVATVNAALRTGATVMMCDVNVEDFNLDVDYLSTFDRFDPKVVIPVHLFGQMADMNRIEKFANSTGSTILEDASQSHGSTVTGYSPRDSDLATYSMYATKNIASGEGGIICTNDETLASKMRIMRNQGMREKYEYLEVGNNYRLTDLQAAVALPQMSKYKQVIMDRTKNANYFNENLSSLTGIITPQVMPGRTHVWHQYTIRVTPESGLTRDEVSRKLAERGIGSGIYYPKLVPDYDVFAQHPKLVKGETPNAALVATQVLSLPVHQHLTNDDLSVIVDAMTDLFGSN
jgi:dTDP-4-amino-4,6-dideoxygalactose transaminase